MVTAEPSVWRISPLILLALTSTYILPHVSATIVVINEDDSTNATYDDSPASFGMSLTDLTMIGAVVDSDPSNLGCNADSITPPPLWPPMNDTERNWFIVLLRGNCTFAQKAINAQNAGYDALIVRNEINKPDKSSLICGAPFPCDNITIYVTMVSNSDGRDLATLYNYRKNFSVSISGSPSETYLYYVLPFIVVVGVVLLVVASFFVFRFIRECRNNRKARLTRWALRKIPTRKFKKGVDHYDCCSICLDDFAEGDKLRILPCDHAYHIKCIDPWLLNNRRNCPVCKRKVRIPGETDSDDEESGNSRSATATNAHTHNHAINSSDTVQDVRENRQQDAVLPIGEGRQSGMSVSSNDGAPLIRRDTGNGMNCCIPRSYHSTDSLAATSTAPSSSLPSTLPGSQLSGASQSVQAGSILVGPPVPTVAATVAASSSVSSSLPPVSFLPAAAPTQRQQVHRNAACDEDDDDDERESHTDTSSVSCTDVSYSEDHSQNNNNNTVTSEVHAAATSEQHVIVHVDGDEGVPQAVVSPASSQNHASSETNSSQPDPGAV